VGNNRPGSSGGPHDSSAGLPDRGGADMSHTEYRWVGTCEVCGVRCVNRVTAPPIGNAGSVEQPTGAAYVLGRSAARLAGFNGALIP
jgi:hypothetical protein